MARVPDAVADFLGSRRVAVAGVSRGSGSAANPVFRKLRDSGYEVLPVNPRAKEVEGIACYPDLASVPGDLDGVVVATPPGVAIEVARQAAGRGPR